MTQKVNSELLRLKSYNNISAPNISIFDNLNQLYLFKRNIFFFMKVHRRFNFFFFNFRVTRCYLKRFRIFFFGFFLSRFKLFIYKKRLKLKFVKNKTKYKFLHSFLSFYKQSSTFFLKKNTHYNLFNFFFVKYLDFYQSKL